MSLPIDLIYLVVHSMLINKDDIMGYSGDIFKCSPRIYKSNTSISLYFFPAPPPSYDSLFGRMREARKISKGIFDFLKNIVVLLLGTSKSILSIDDR